MDLKEMLLKEGIVKIKPPETPEEEWFLLNSGRRSRLFIDIKQASLNPTILKEIVNLIKNMELDNFNSNFDVFGSVAVGGVPIASVLEFIYNVPQVIVRTEKHERGTKAQVIGNCKGKKVLLIEDVATTGGSIITAVSELDKAGAICNDVIVIVDREEGAQELCRENKLNLYPILKKSDFRITEEI